MKTIKTNGITFLTSLKESPDWYWGTDYTYGDLYEAEELFQQGDFIPKNRMIFIHHPEGTLIEPILAENGQYFGRPSWDQGQLILLMVDFPRQQINLFRCDPNTSKTVLIVALPLSMVDDCYNLHLFSNPLMLTKHSKEDTFQILWPDKTEMQLGPRECFDHREGDELYFMAWLEDSDYREEVIVRDFHSGQILRRMDGSLVTMPGGQKWLLV